MGTRQFSDSKTSKSKRGNWCTAASNWIRGSRGRRPIDHGKAWARWSDARLETDGETR
jgi:hypothetical protein